VKKKFKEYFLVAKTIWQTLYETIWLSLLENDEELKRGRGYVFLIMLVESTFIDTNLKNLKETKTKRKLLLQN
jgi:hypothetical protein